MLRYSPDMTSMKRVLHICLGLLAAGPAILPAPARAMNYEDASRRAAGELVECAAFYLTSSVSLEKQGHAKEANQFEGFARYALELARVTLPMATLQRKLAVAQAANGELIKDGSLSPLVAKYAETCRITLENPGARMNYWRDQDE